MRLVLILVLIVGAVAGWYVATHHHAAPAAPPADPTTAPGPFASPAPTAPGGPAASAEAPAATAPATVQAALAQADALWAQAHGDVTSPTAPQMALLYSQVLRGLYGQPGQHARADALVADRLTPLGQALFFTRTRYADDPTGVFGIHVVQPGESPDRIARHYGMSQQFLNRLRGRQDPNDGRLQANESLKVVNVKDHGGFYLHICKSDFDLDCYVAGIFAKRYSISHGSPQTPTPVGHTHLVDRAWHPDWTHPQTHEVIHYGDPANILGPIWLPFNADELGQAGIGIHGYTGANGGSGKLVSSGCIRLLNDDAVELYNTLSQPELTPTAVEITP